MKELLLCFKAEYMMCADRFWYYFSKLPFIRNKGMEAIDVEKHPHANRANAIAGMVSAVIFEILKKLFFCVVFMFGPMKAMRYLLNVGDEGFSPTNSYVYFGIIVCAFCGSIINSVIFGTNKNTYCMLHGFKVNPKNLFRSKLLTRSVLEIVSFSVALTVLTMPFAKAFYLSLVIVVSRYIGEGINVLLFRASGRPIMMHRGLGLIVTIASLFLAYFVPYMRGCVPDIYNEFFNTPLFLVTLVVSATFIYYIWNYEGYKKISSIIHTRKQMEETEGISERKVKRVRKISAQKDAGKSSGFEFLNRLFFARNVGENMKGVLIRVSAILVCVIVAGFATYQGHKEIVGKVIAFSTPLLLFIMRFLTSGITMTRHLYMQCDRALLRDHYYRHSGSIITNFLIRLKYLVSIDIIPAAVLSVAFVLTGLMAGQTMDAATIVIECLTVIFLAVFFDIFDLFIYYMMQPYDENGRLTNVAYLVVHVLMLIVCYFYTYIEANRFWMLLCIITSVALMLSLSATLVYRFGKKTFFIRKQKTKKVVDK